MGFKPKNPHVYRVQNQTATVYGQWDWYSKDAEHDRWIKGFELDWYYWDGAGHMRHLGNEKQDLEPNRAVSGTHYSEKNVKVDPTYSAVWMKVRAIPNQHKVNGKDVDYFTADWSDWAKYDNPIYEQARPDAPSVPTVEIEDTTMTISVDYYNDQSKPQSQWAQQIRFEIVENNSSTSKLTGWLDIVTNHVETKIAVNTGSKYKVRAQARNNTNYRMSDWSEYTENSDTEPGDVTSGIKTLEALTSTSVRLTWDEVPSAKRYEIQYTQDKSYFFDTSGNVTTVTVDRVTTAIITGLEIGHEYFFRMRAVNDAGEGPWSEIKSIILGRLPAAPTIWSSTTTGIIGRQVILYWVHNAQDGSSQTYAEIELTVNGVVQPVITVQNTTEEFEKDKTSQYILDTSQYGADTKILWRVRTKGVLPDYGEWSGQKTITMYVQPVLTLRLSDHTDWIWDSFNFNTDNIWTAKGLLGGDISLLEHLLLFISTTYAPHTQKPVSYDISITSNSDYTALNSKGEEVYILKDQVVFQKQIDTDNDLQLAIMPGDISVENNVTYTVHCKLALDSGLTAEDTAEFTVQWEDSDIELNASLGYDEDTYTMRITPFATDENDDLVSSILLSVYRRDFDGGYTKLAEYIENKGSITITDPHPNLDYARYRIVGIDMDTGRVIFYDLPGYPISEPAIIIQWEENWIPFDYTGEEALEQPPWSGSLLRLPYNITLSDKHDPDSALIKYIGREHPISYFGTQKGHTATWTFEVPITDKETYYQIRRLAAFMGNAYVREPSGSGYYASLKVSYNSKYNDMKYSISMDVTRVDGGE